MYRCQLCKAQVPAGTPCRRLVVETRPKVYRRRPEVHRVVRFDKEKRKRKIVDLDDPGGSGLETVREVMVCPDCHSGPCATAKAGGVRGADTATA